LIKAAREGDRRALRALFDRYQPLVMSYCMIAAGRDRDRAKDLAQETFVRAFRHLDQLEDEDRFRPWLMSIARNVCRTNAATEGQRRRLLEEAALELDLSPEDHEEREQRIATVRGLLESLPDDQLKEIVMMRYSEPEHTTRQIAERLGVPHGTVTVKLMRFRAAIKKRILRALIDLEGAAS
jgi:RNA polymerase sigma-70 factor (ECF subfamily)